MSESEYLGVVYIPETLEVVSVINPDYDELLDDPAWIHNDPSKYMLHKMKKKDFFEGEMDFISCKKVIDTFHERQK